jgi:hypothetical protein
VGQTLVGVCILSNHGEYKMTCISLIAIMLTALRMSVEDAITELRIIVEKVYTKKLAPAEKTKALRDCMEALLIKRNLPVDLRLETGNYAEAMGYALPSMQYLVFNEPTDLLQLNG